MFEFDESAPKIEYTIVISIHYHVTLSTFDTVV